MSAPEDLLSFQLKAVGIPHEREVAFAKPRRWRADFIIPHAFGTGLDMTPLLIEIDGATWTGGRHVRGSGVEADCEKLGEAVVLGYRVIRVTPKMVEDGRALALIERCLT